MLPQKHFLISGASVAPFSFHHPEWILVSGVVSMAIDTDVVVLVWIRSRTEKSLKKFRNPAEIFTRFEPFMKAFFETGVLKTAMITHLAISAFILAVTFVFFRGVIIPVSIGVLTHLLSDIHNFRKFIPSRDTSYL